MRLRFSVDSVKGLTVSDFILPVCLVQGQIYIGASRSMAPGPEVLGGRGGLLSEKKSWKLILSNLRGPQSQTGPPSISTTLGGPPLNGCHRLRGGGVPLFMPY